MRVCTAAEHDDFGVACFLEVALRNVLARGYVCGASIRARDLLRPIEYRVPYHCREHAKLTTAIGLFLRVSSSGRHHHHPGDRSFTLTSDISVGKVHDGTTMAAVTHSGQAAALSIKTAV